MMSLNTRRELLERVFQDLLQAFGPQHWWPADSPFEVIVGAILTQNAAWKNVEKSIAQLREHGLLTPGALCGCDSSLLASLIRSSGYYNQKTKKLKTFCEYLWTNYEGNLDEFLALDMDRLRLELLGIRGIGPETADSIVLYAAGHPSFVVDAYTHRIFSRHGWVPEEMDYEELRSFFMDALEPDVPFFQEFHALLVRAGHLYCRRKPLCGDCVLKPWLVEGGADGGI